MTALNDADASVQSWAGLALGEIGDPKTVPALMALAADPKQDAGIRCNAIGSLGQMKAADATELVRHLWPIGAKRCRCRPPSRSTG